MYIETVDNQEFIMGLINATEEEEILVYNEDEEDALEGLGPEGVSTFSIQPKTITQSKDVPIINLFHNVNDYVIPEELTSMKYELTTDVKNYAKFNLFIVEECDVKLFSDNFEYMSRLYISSIRNSRTTVVYVDSNLEGKESLKESLTKLGIFYSEDLNSVKEYLNRMI